MSPEELCGKTTFVYEQVFLVFVGKICDIRIVRRWEGMEAETAGSFRPGKVGTGNCLLCWTAAVGGATATAAAPVHPPGGEEGYVGGGQNQ